MGTHANNRLELLLSVLLNVKLPLAAVLLFLVQLAHQGVHPAGDGLLVAQIGFGQGRLINQLFQQRFRIATLHTANHFLRGVELGDQTLQRFTGQRWRAGVCVQGRTIKGDRDLVLIHRLVIFNVLFLLAFLHFVQRRLGNVDMATFNNFRHLTVEEGQQQPSAVMSVATS